MFNMLDILCWETTKGNLYFLHLFFEHWRRCREWNPYPDDVFFFFFKNLPLGSNYQPIANLYHGLWNSTAHEHFEPKREGMEDYFPLQTMSLVLYFHNSPAIFEWFAPKHPGRVWWKVIFDSGFLCAVLLEKPRKYEQHREIPWPQRPCFFGCRFWGVLDLATEASTQTDPAKLGCGKDLGTRFVHVGKNEWFLFGQNKISLDDSFDQSRKKKLKFGEVALQTQLGCRWMATANRSTFFFFKVDFCCLHRLDVWNPPQVGCSGC